MLTLVLPASFTSLLLLVSDLNIPMLLLSVIVTTTEHAPSAFFSTALGGKLTFQLGWDIQESLDPRNSGPFPPACVWDQAGTCFVFFLALFLPRRQPY